MNKKNKNYDNFWVNEQYILYNWTNQNNIKIWKKVLPALQVQLINQLHSGSDSVVKEPRKLLNTDSRKNNLKVFYAHQSLLRLYHYL